MNVHRPIGAALLLAIVAACNADEPDIPRENYALIFTEARSVSGGGFVTLPVANFVNSSQLSFSSSTQPVDQCIETTYDDTRSGIDLGPISFLDPGDDVRVASGGQSRELALVVDPETDAETYEISAGQGGLPYTPGDTIEFTGGGSDEFPLFSIRARTAEAFTFTEPSVPAQGQPIVLTWTTTGVQPGSAMLVSLRYRSNTSTGRLDRQIFCEMVDDGSFNVPSQYAGSWRVSDSTQTALSRWRTQFKQLGPNTFGVVSSNFTVPTEGSTPTFRRSAIVALRAR